MVDILIYVFLCILAIGGIILTLFSFPGVWLIYIAIVVLAFMGGFAVITPVILIVLFFLSLLSTFIDNITVALGAKSMGGSKYGMAGAVIGLMIGSITGGIVGMLIGSFLGAVLGEYLFSKKDANGSLKAGIGSFLGIVTSIVLKIGVCIGMIIYILTLIF